MFDLIIIGGSAAATAAGIYAARRNLHFKIITKEFGGEVATSGEIGNWPGAISTDGLTLAEQFRAHLASYGVEPEEGVWVESIHRRDDGTFSIHAKKDEKDVEYTAKTVIVATGVHPRLLNVPGEKEYRGKGVTYCTVCDGPLFGGKVTAVVGGGNSALEAGLMMADIASKVYMVNKNAFFKGDTILIDKLEKKDNVEFIYNAKTTEIVGDQFVKALRYADAADAEGATKEIAVEGVFLHIGMLPNSALVPDDVEKTNTGQIVVSKHGETNIPGLYAAGDVTDVEHNQIVIATGQGAAALLQAVTYLNKLSS